MPAPRTCNRLGRDRLDVIHVADRIEIRGQDVVTSLIATVAAIGAGCWAQALWADWDRRYRAEHRAPPPGGDAGGYITVIVALLVAGGLVLIILG